MKAPHFHFLPLILAFAFSLPMVSFSNPSTNSNDATCLTNALQIRNLNPEIAAKNIQVQLQGIVTYHDAKFANLFLQDSTSGIFAIAGLPIETNLTEGQTIELTGITEKGEYAPLVKATHILILENSPQLVPRHVPMDQLFNGLEDAQWIEVTGIVRSSSLIGQRRYLNLVMNGQRVSAYVRDLTESQASDLANATIRIRGVCYSTFNSKGQLRIPWLATCSMTNVIIEKSAIGRPQMISIANLAQFNSPGHYGNLAAVKGVVSLQKTDGTLFIQDHGFGLCVEMAKITQVSPGDEVLVTGYSALGQYVPTLEDATVQVISHGDSPVALSTNLDTLLKSPDIFDGVLVRLKAVLINEVKNNGSQTLILQSSNAIFTAMLKFNQTNAQTEPLELGSEIELTGVFAPQSPEKWMSGGAYFREISVPIIIPDPLPESVQILLRSLSDVTVIKPPSWWTLSRMLWATTIMAFFLIAGLAWVVILRHQVNQQTRIIEDKVHRAGILEERDRIAREFHDTLEQELAAISIQLDTVGSQLVTSPDLARRMLNLARDMARRSLNEVRRSVWDLRSHLLENKDLKTALNELAVEVSSSANVAVLVESSGLPRRLSTIAEHNLLRITQEALANAIKHSNAKTITVSLSYEISQIKLQLRDNGSGFDSSKVGQPSGGHFGLLDMKERAEKIGARFTLASGAGHGTTIELLIIDKQPAAEPM